MENQTYTSDKEYTTLYNKISYQKLVFSFIGFLSFIYTVDSNAIKGYEFQFLIPLFFTISYMIFAPPIKKLGFGYLTLNIVWLIRYCLGPVLYKLTDYQIINYSNVSTEDLYIGLILILIELLLITISCGLFFKVQMKKENARLGNSYIQKTPLNGRKNKISNIIILSVLVLSLLVIVVDINALKSFNFIADTEYINISKSKFGISILILICSKYVITVYLIEKMSILNLRRPNIFFVFASIAIVMVSISFFNGISRSSVLIEAIAYITLLINYFPGKRKEIMTICFTVLSIIILTITLYRFYDTQDLSESAAFFDYNNLSTTINSYFAGQQNVALGVKTLKLYGGQYEILTLFKDLLANTVLLSGFVSNIPGTVEYFNLTIYGHTYWADQISPTITQVLGLFNVLGFFVPIVIIYFIIKMDNYSDSNNYAFGIFLFSFIAVNLAFYSTGNISILSTAFTNKFIPLLILYKLTKIQFKR